MTTNQRKPTPHQQRVLAALLRLEAEHGWAWWPRAYIGEVVGAGGFHRVIQIKTMAALKAAGLVQTERSFWPEKIRLIIRCGCACCEWGLTPAGREWATSNPLRWPADAIEDVERLGFHCSHEPRDEDDEQWRNFGGDGDDDDDPCSPSPSPAPLEPCYA